MFHFTTLLLSLSIAGSVTAAPTHFNKRIAQVIADSTQKWEGACNKANGGQQCNAISVNAFTTLLAAAGPCDQQDNADIMMDLSKQLGSSDMIKFAQIFCQQPRNTPDSLSVVYCQKAPRNAELNGLFQCQFQGANPTSFTGGLKAGDPGTIPFGQSKTLTPPGSCPAHTQGPIADGSQLSDQVSSPGVPSTTGTGNSQTQNSPSVSPTSSNTPSPTGSSASPSSTPSSSSSKGFAFQNGKDAEALNQKFASLTPNSPCNEGEDACVNGAFAQCVNGKFAMTSCGGGQMCSALPLVNKPGTTIACDTPGDAATRLANALGSGN